MMESNTESDYSSMYSISDLEALSGIKAHTIRIWEKRYGILKPTRTDTNIRYYSNDDLKKLLNICLLNQSGYKISVISSMTASEIAESVRTAALLDIDGQEERLLLSLLEMDELLFEKVFTNLIDTKGFEQTITEIIFPFFQRVGIMWQCGSINPAQEHFFSNLVRSKIIHETELMSYVPSRNAKTAVLFLPEGELHEIGLLFYNYALRKRHYKTIYLGQSVPLESLERIYKISRPSAIITSLTTAILKDLFVGFCDKVCRQAGDTLVYFTGPIPEQFNAQLPENARFVDDLMKTLNLSKTMPFDMQLSATRHSGEQ